MSSVPDLSTFVTHTNYFSERKRDSLETSSNTPEDSPFVSFGSITSEVDEKVDIITQKIASTTIESLEEATVHPFRRTISDIGQRVDRNIGSNATQKKTIALATGRGASEPLETYDDFLPARFAKMPLQESAPRTGPIFRWLYASNRTGQGRPQSHRHSSDGWQRD